MPRLLFQLAFTVTLEEFYLKKCEKESRRRLILCLPAHKLHASQRISGKSIFILWHYYEWDEENVKLDDSALILQIFIRVMTRSPLMSLALAWQWVNLKINRLVKLFPIFNLKIHRKILENCREIKFLNFAVKFRRFRGGGGMEDIIFSRSSFGSLNIGRRKMETKSFLLSKSSSEERKFHLCSSSSVKGFNNRNFVLSK